MTIARHLTSACSRRARVSRGLQGGSLRSRDTQRDPLPAADTRALGGPPGQEES